MMQFWKALASDWRIKVTAQNAIGLLPGQAGFNLNEWLVRRIKGEVDNRIDLRMRLGLTLDALRVLQSKCGARIAGRSVLELGTGWHGIDLLVFYILGSKSIVTVDHHRHLSFKALRSKIAWLDDEHTRSALAEFGEAGLINERLAALTRFSEGHSELEGFLAELNVSYRISRSCLTPALAIRPKSIDLFYSSSVLQRIPERDLERNVEYIGEKLLADKAVLFHLTDQRDVNALNDKRLWHLHYLCYSDFFFQTFVSGRFNSQNRLREVDFVDLFERSGITVSYIKSIRREADVEHLRTLRVGRRFSGYPVEELAKYHSQIAGHRSVAQNDREKALLEHDVIIV